MKYTKPFLTFDQQLQRAMDRGMHVRDIDEAVRLLSRIGYYRLSAYWYHWRVENSDGNLAEQYVDAADFDDAIALYSFDRQLRLILLDAIERIEVALRVAMANTAGRRDPFIHQSPAHLGPFAERANYATGQSEFETFADRCNEVYIRSSEDFVKHCRKRYEDGPAIWVYIETWDFGLLCRFYKLLIDDDRLAIAQMFGVDRHGMFESWIACLNYVRNVCAHHGRLFRRSLVVKPGTKDMRSIPELHHVTALNDQRISKLYPVLAILIFMMRSVSPESQWNTRLMLLLNEFPDVSTASLSDYGFPNTWQTEELWQ